MYNLKTPEYSFTVIESDPSEIILTPFGITEVIMGEYKLSDSELISYDYCNCIALAGVGRQISLLGHFERIVEPNCGDHRQFKQALAALQTIVKPELIVLAGGKCDYDDGEISKTLALNDRGFALANVNALLLDQNTGQSIPELVVSWNTSPADSVDIFVSNTLKQIVCSQTHYQ